MSSIQNKRKINFMGVSPHLSNLPLAKEQLTKQIMEQKEILKQTNQKGKVIVGIPLYSTSNKQTTYDFLRSNGIHPTLANLIAPQQKRNEDFFKELANHAKNSGAQVENISSSSLPLIKNIAALKFARDYVKTARKKGYLSMIVSNDVSEEIGRLRKEEESKMLLKVDDKHQSLMESQIKSKLPHIVVLSPHSAKSISDKFKAPITFVPPSAEENIPIIQKMKTRLVTQRKSR